MIRTIEYLKARIAERSTWLAIGAAVTGVSSLAAPFSYMMIGVGVIGTLVPSTVPKPCDPVKSKDN